MILGPGYVITPQGWVGDCSKGAPIFNLRHSAINKKHQRELNLVEKIKGARTLATSSNHQKKKKKNNPHRTGEAKPRNL